MSSRRRVATSALCASLIASLVGLASTGPVAATGTRAALQPTVPTSAVIPGTKCRAFPTNNVWHADISELPTHPQSAAWLANTNAGGTRLHPDFGPAYGEQPVPYGIPITIDARAAAPSTPVRFGYADESDRVRYPLSRSSKVEGGWDASGDRHVITIHAATCRLYETWDTHLRSNGWYAGSGAVWSLGSNALRPAGWTSADAAGLPILPGLLRWDEIVAGRVDHAIRFTVGRTKDSYLWPARHKAGSTSSPAFPPMGARFRLRADFNMNGYSRNARVILTGMKRHGLVLADNGSDWFFQGTSDARWPGALISELKRIPASSFEAVNVDPLRMSPNSAQARR